MWNTQEWNHSFSSTASLLVFLSLVFKRTNDSLLLFYWSDKLSVTSCQELWELKCQYLREMAASVKNPKWQRVCPVWQFSVCWVLHEQHFYSVLIVSRDRFLFVSRISLHRPSNCDSSCRVVCWSEILLKWGLKKTTAASLTHWGQIIQELFNPRPVTITGVKRPFKWTGSGDISHPHTELHLEVK